MLQLSVSFSGVLFKWAQVLLLNTRSGAALIGCYFAILDIFGCTNSNLDTSDSAKLAS